MKRLIDDLGEVYLDRGIAEYTTTIEVDGDVDIWDEPIVVLRL